MPRHHLVVLLTILAAGQGCEPKRAPPPAPLRVSADQFHSLRWIEGRWRGSDGSTESFFEEYRFTSDHAIRSYSFVDSTLIEVEDSAMIELAGDTVTSRGSNSSWVVTALNPSSVTFEPQLNATNSYTWASTSDSSWTATLSWRDADGDPKQRVYQMRRLSQ